MIQIYNHYPNGIAIYNFEIKISDIDVNEISLT